MNQWFWANLVVLQSAGGALAGKKEALDPWKLIMEATPVVKFVLLLLVLMSLASWFIMGAKLVRVMQATLSSGRFLDLFWDKNLGAEWSAQRLETIYGKVKAYESSPLASVFRAGYVELARMSAQASGQQAGGDIDNIERALRRTAGNELTGLENFLPFLATTAATAPFIGLLGTVWGIMNSFIAIHGNKNASLDVVAPGIAEALIATAIGLAAAIPAVMAYNFFVRKIRVLESEMESFSSDYLNIVRRHFLRA